MKFLRLHFLIQLAVFTGFTFCQAQNPKPGTAPQPKLVVGIVVDQMRFDYIQRFWNQFGDGGFKRMVNTGYSFTNCQYNYVPTETAPGHASIFTGTTPSVNGIIQNTWVDRDTRVVHSSVVDARHTVVGPGRNLPSSPAWLLTTTIADEIKAASNFQSKVIGVSIKDRGAILPGGATANAAFWVDDSSGKFISSTYYFADKKLPGWAETFNSKDYPHQFLAEGWKLSHPLSFYTATNVAADSLYEGVFYKDSLPVFPYYFKPEPVMAFRYTSYGNTYVKNFAKAAIKNYQLGKGKVTDVLTISFSSTDFVGHTFGINSLELEETYIQLDADLADLLTYLDSAIGKNNVLLFLTADHGAGMNPQFANDHNLPGGLLDMPGMRLGLRKLLGDSPNEDSLLLGIFGHHIYLNRGVIAQRHRNYDSVCTVVANYLNQFPGISIALTAKQLLETDYNDDMLSKLQNGFNPERSGDVLFTMKSGFMEWKPKGTSHGSHYEYDCHVPLLFWGWKIKPGSDNAPVVIPDIAPTISSLMGINAPSGATGKPILKNQ